MPRTRTILCAATTCLLALVGCSSTESHEYGECSVEETKDGALITCADGSSALIEHGHNGANGEPGTPGSDGTNGKPGQNGTDGEDGVDCQTPASTYYMMNYKLIATKEFDNWIELAEEHYEGCPENGTASTAEECYDNYLRSKYSAHRYYATRGNLFPDHECGAQVMEIVKTIDEYVADEGQYGVWRPNTEDSDGDGISNYNEYFMGLNPCTSQSHGCTNDADGDFDYDGIPNGEDSHPFCPEDASYWPAECI